MSMIEGSFEKSLRSTEAKARTLSVEEGPLANQEEKNSFETNRESPER
ncbi:MAG: hypothetical protein ACKVU1_03710 [bacterium]